MKRAAPPLALAALLALGFASVADAHILTFKRARNATLNVVQAECAKVRTCDGAAAGPCNRVSLHRVRCRGHFYGQNQKVGDYDCHRQVTILIYPGGDDRFFKSGRRKCVPNEEHPVS